MKKSLLFLLILPLLAFGQKDKKLTDKTVEKSFIAAHLKFLSSDALRGRDTPSQGLEVAAEYLRTQLEYMGVKPFDAYPDYFQPISMKKIVRPSSGEIKADSTTFLIKEDFLMMNGGNVDWSGAVVRLAYGTEEELDSVDVKGKYILCNPGDGSDQSVRNWFAMTVQKRTAAKKAGALGVIEFYNSAQVPWSLLVRYFSGDQVALDRGEVADDFPHIWLNDPERKASNAFDGVSKATILTSGGANEKFTVNNVVGYVEGTDPELNKTYVTYSAHYDHVGIGRADSTGDNIYNGTRDNAVGTVTVLEAARNISKYPTKRSALFVLFAGEEKGLLGSEWFVDHSPVDLKQIAFCFNSDNGGYNDTKRATVIGIERTTAFPLLVQAIEAYGLTPGDDANFKEEGLFDRSDNVSFAKKGIPAPSFGMGVDQMDDRIFATYHQPSDEFETIDMDYLYTFYRAYVYSGRLIGNMKETPFWIEGDKYYEIGKELYGN